MNTKILSKLPMALVLCSLSLTGCSFSTSSESSSDSSKGVFNLVSSPFTSSSDSSRTGQEKYENDVTDFTAEYVVSSNSSVDDFRDYLGELAKKHGVSNWESNRVTYVGIGRGLKKAKLGAPQIAAFTDSMSNNDPMKRQAIEEGLKK